MNVRHKDQEQQHMINLQNSHFNCAVVVLSLDSVHFTGAWFFLLPLYFISRFCQMQLIRLPAGHGQHWEMDCSAEYNSEMRSYLRDRKAQCWCWSSTACSRPKGNESSLWKLQLLENSIQNSLLLAWLCSQDYSKPQWVMLYLFYAGRFTKYDKFRNLKHQICLFKIKITKIPFHRFLERENRNICAKVTTFSSYLRGFVNSV